MELAGDFAGAPYFAEDLAEAANLAGGSQKTSTETSQHVVLKWQLNRTIGRR
jgi:hypothetical protein